MENLQKRLKTLKTELDEAWTKLNLTTKLEEIEKLEVLVAQPGLWTDPELARTKTAELARLNSETHEWLMLKTQVMDLDEILTLGEEDLIDEIMEQLEMMEERLMELKKALRFTGKYDGKDAILRITAGVGGTEAMDWAGMLERMYLRFFEKKGLKAGCLERTAGEEAGIKTAVYEIDGVQAYGLLKSEHGVHRLVRLSPFNADNLRQTSFALVEVLPRLEAENDLIIDEKDLRVDVYRSGGHGGQSVNTTDSAVRITHLPTGTVVAIQNERSQLQNRAKAMEILRGKLIQMQQEQQAESIDKLRAGESAKWGQQIRNYVLQPYKLVKDTRTKYEETDVMAVLDGKIEGFVDAYLESMIGQN
ncbi:MAG: peptide chain release factor 2 [Candidatus Saccharibacteria bacterium]|nr:peptide chain release factor 2 [Candidatus Saccharibacteria bacterium]